MKRLFIISLVLIGLLAGLVASSCAKGPKEAIVVEKAQPQYGGTLNLVSTVDTYGFDDAIVPHANCYLLKFTNDEIVQGDWSKGNAGGYGTKECEWFLPGVNRLQHKAGSIAESWELQGNDTVILRLRKGVRFHNKPPANGREVTVDDVVFSLKRHLTVPTSYFRLTYPKAAETTQITTPDPYTVVIKTNPEYMIIGDIFTILNDYACIFPKEAVEQFGNMNDWKNSVGTGPFMLTEYMRGSHAILSRNPTFWEKNPVGPGKGDQLPYIDQVKWLVVPDESTQHALFRAGDIDILSCDWEVAQEFLKDTRLKYVRYLDDYAQAVIFMRTDKKNSPYADVRVRRALSMAIDNKKILNEYYGGEGTLLKWPIVYAKEYSGAYVPLEQLPRSVQELFEYHPDKAKQLLAEAGYPNGFKAKIICYNHRAYLDPLQMVKDMWSKIGVELEIEPKDYATFQGIAIRRAYDDMLYGWYGGIGAFWKGISWTTPSYANGSYINDPRCAQARQDMLAAFPDENKIDQIHREFMPYLLDQAYVIQLPAGYSYRFWWPWVRNYNGESSIGHYNVGSFSKYIWIDQEMKKALVGK